MLPETSHGSEDGQPPRRLAALEGVSAQRVRPGGGPLAIVILTLLSAVSLLDRQVMSLMVGPIERDLNLSDFDMGLLQGLAFAAFYAVAGLPLGWLADRFPRRIVIWAGVTVWSVSAAACGLASSFWTLALARFGVGAGEASLSPAGNSMLAELVPARKLAAALAVLAVGAIAGNGLATGLGGYLVSLSERAGPISAGPLGPLSSWQLVFLISGGPGLVLAPLIFLVQEPRRAHKHIAGGPRLQLTLSFVWARRGFFGAHFAGFGLLSMLGWSFISWTPAHMMRAFHLGVLEVTLPLAMTLAIAGGVGTLFWGALVDRRFDAGRDDAHLKTYSVLALVMSVAGAVAFRTHGPVLFIAAIVPVVACMTVAPVATAALQIVCPNEMRGQVNALYLFVMNGVGLAIGPPPVGALADGVFSGPNALGDALSLLFAVAGPVAALALWGGGGAMRRALEARAGD